jgi:hypothetical protein
MATVAGTARAKYPAMVWAVSGVMIWKFDA